MAKAGKIYTLRCHKYFGIPVNKGRIDALQLITHNPLSALVCAFSSVLVLSPTGLSCLLAGILIRLKLKYSPTVSALTKSTKRLHSTDLRGHPRSETKSSSILPIFQL
ncbi:hypothetical protein BDC45DRAFT_530322 [Circinella umbellata]|nr:hypothetical protein BDC45DRAFT_530322 [Circinella umbellata]